MRKTIRCAVAALSLVLSAGILSAQDGAAVYRAACASCHDAGRERAPNRAALELMSPERVLTSLESGSMISMTAARSAVERRAVAEFVTGKSFQRALVTRPSPQSMCSAATAGVAGPLAGSSWNGWSATNSNSRYQDAAAAGFTAAAVPRLKLKWAFGFPGDIAADAQPSVAGGRVFVGSQSGIVYALSTATGCVHWFFQAAAPVRAAVTVGRIDANGRPRDAAFIGDRAANIYAVDAAHGPAAVEDDGGPVIPSRGSPVLRCFTTGGSMFPSRPAKKAPERYPATNAATFAAASSHSMAPAENRSGRRTRLPSQPVRP